MTEGLLTDEENQRYMALRSLFGHPGWQILVNELKESIKTAPEDAFWKAKSFDELVAQRIRCQERVILINYPEFVEGRTQAIIQQRAQAIADEHEA